MTNGPTAKPRAPFLLLGALARAIAGATGVWIKDLPITPERILAAIHRKKAAEECVAA